MPQVWLFVASLQEYQVVPQCTGALPAAQEDLCKAHQPVRTPEEWERWVSKTHQGIRRGWDRASWDYCTVIENSCPRKQGPPGPNRRKEGKEEMGEVALEEKAVRKDLEFPGALSHLSKE